MHAIVYSVELAETFKYKGFFNGTVLTHPSIKDKDLILKTNYIDDDSWEVCFVPVNVTPQFYQDVLRGEIRNADEYRREINDIYNIGDVLGYVLV